MGWMHGMPQAIKDPSNAAGLPTTLGSPLMRDFVPAEDRLSFLDPLKLEPENLRRIQIGWLGGLEGYLPMEPGILEVCEKGLQRLAGLGCRVEPAKLGMAPDRVWQA